MMGNFLLVAQQVAILFVLIGTGMLCRRMKLVDADAVRGMVNVLILVVTPAIVIDCFQRPFDPAMLWQLALAFALAAVAHFVAMAFAYLTARGDERTRPVLRAAMVFSNAGFMGIPLEYAILGPAGVFYGIVYVAMFNVFMWSWGLAQMKNGGWHAASAGMSVKMLCNPGTAGLAVGLPLFLGSVTLPAIVGRPIHLLAELNTPLAMLVIGYYLAGADLKSRVRMPSVQWAAFVRLLAFPLVMLAVIYPLRGWLDRTMVLAILTAAGAPVAAMVAMFAAKFDRDVDMSVSLVSGTTILSIFTMPTVIALAMAIL